MVCCHSTLEFLPQLAFDLLLALAVQVLPRTACRSRRFGLLSFAPKTYPVSSFSPRLSSLSADFLIFIRPGTPPGLQGLPFRPSSIFVRKELTEAFEQNPWKSAVNVVQRYLAYLLMESGVMLRILAITPQVAT